MRVECRTLFAAVSSRRIKLSSDRMAWEQIWQSSFHTWHITKLDFIFLEDQISHNVLISCSSIYLGLINIVNFWQKIFVHLSSNIVSIILLIFLLHASMEQVYNQSLFFMFHKFESLTINWGRGTLFLWLLWVHLTHKSTFLRNYEIKSSFIINIEQFIKKNTSKETYQTNS